MASTSLTVNPQLITVVSTTAHNLNLDNIMGDNQGVYALMTMIAGTAVKFNVGAVIDDTNSASYTAADKEMFYVPKGTLLHYKGGAGSETFKVSIIK